VLLIYKGFREGERLDHYAISRARAFSESQLLLLDREVTPSQPHASPVDPDSDSTMEHQRCYIYTPTDTEERAPKRQRLSKGDPKARLTERLAIFRSIWSLQEEKIQVRHTISWRDMLTITDNARECR
jgi:hypothetical protein